MSNETRSDDKRVVKNTLFLYMRMLLLLFVGLFTSRVVLRTLGVENYGIQSVIAGFLSMFSIITSSMSTAISRFITVELGIGNPRKLSAVFSTSMLVQIVMGVIVIIAIETIGLWFLNNHMNIPAGREAAAQWCLHCATATTFLNLLNIPLNAEIIAHERMSAFAYMSILDAGFKLAICYSIYVSPF
ncbi:MAG: lipopolysaccharide biosynthesis protein, partial [Proteobacteria bacterium]|nr:lipopolysaccharide biosynthesis protein [Pseudomonadota bacterium]